MQGNVGGLLLYAKTDESIIPDGMVKMSANWIGATTLDLNTDFNKIAMQLDRIAEDFFGVNGKLMNEASVTHTN